MLKIWKVTFNDVGWHERLPSYTVVAENSDEAKKIAIEENKAYRDWDVWATEFKIEGYIIEIYDEKTYMREKKLGNLIN